MSILFVPVFLFYLFSTSLCVLRCVREPTLTRSCCCFWRWCVELDWRLIFSCYLLETSASCFRICSKTSQTGMYRSERVLDIHHSYPKNKHFVIFFFFIYSPSCHYKEFSFWSLKRSQYIMNKSQDILILCSEYYKLKQKMMTDF